MPNRCGVCIHFCPSDMERIRSRGYNGVCQKLMFTRLDMTRACSDFARRKPDAMEPAPKGPTLDEHDASPREIETV
ncbi:MAG: hypothetical protein ACLFTB_06000 [Desulfovibrionales bacterium]